MLHRFLSTGRPVSVQDADAAVALNLFCSRVSKHHQSCCDSLSAVAAALPEALSALQAYEAMHNPANKTASAAQTAHEQVQQAQVRRNPWFSRQSIPGCYGWPLPISTSLSVEQLPTASLRQEKASQQCLQSTILATLQADQSE